MILYRSRWIMIVVFGLLLSACPSQEQLNEDFVLSAKNGDIQRVNSLLKKGVDIEAMDQKYGATALMWAAHEGHTDIVKILLDKGVRINVQQKDGCTALWYAAQQGKLEAAKILIASGADLSIASNDGKKPTDIAAELGHNDIAALIEKAKTGGK